jgi:hypothetical protein
MPALFHKRYLSCQLETTFAGPTHGLSAMDLEQLDRGSVHEVVEVPEAVIRVGRNRLPKKSDRAPGAAKRQLTSKRSQWLNHQPQQDDPRCGSSLDVSMMRAYRDAPS